MTTTVIQTDSLGKEYRRGSGGSSGLLRDTLAKAMRSPASLFRRERAEKFWALRNVSLEVKESEVLGLIGRNGSGKTTLLKILSRITQPTEGWAEIHGRVGSLLEVGTGFHAELTGRENIYLSGAILGMGKQEISRKFDEIVAFAELDKFIDTAVKHYSSGMYVRLAFAVAAHLEPEILLVDEVLAVGDINFQKKCLGKMGDVARAGRTVVLVSHQLNQIRRLCQRVVWIDDGHIHQNGPTHEVVSAYESAMARGERNREQQPKRAGTKGRFIRWEIEEPGGSEPHTLTTLGQVIIKFHLQTFEQLRRSTHGVALYNSDRNLVWGTASYSLDFPQGSHTLVYHFPYLPLRPGRYSWLVSLFDDSGELDMWDAVPEMLVATKDHQHARDEWAGALNIPSEFSVCTERGKHG
jgi:lipopolysaccharide transport system ATP-binding protein